MKADNKSPIPMAAQSKAGVCVCLLAGIAGSNAAGAWMSVCCVCCVLCVVCCRVEVLETGRSLVQESTKVCACVRVCVCACVCVLCVIRCNKNPLHLQWIDEMGSEKEAKKRREKKNKR